MDNAVFVSGSLSVRDDEEIKLLVSTADELIENSKYEELSKRMSAKKEPEKAAERPKPDNTVPKRISKIYLRVPDLEGMAYKKAKNIVDIFFGQTQVIFYDSSCSRYMNYSVGIEASEYIVKELKTILGEENVVVK